MPHRRSSPGAGAVRWRYRVTGCAYPSGKIGGQVAQRPAREPGRPGGPGRSPDPTSGDGGRSDPAPSTCSSPTRSTSTSRVRGPQRSTRSRWAAVSAAWASDQQLAGGAGGPQLDHAVEVGALAGRPPDGVGLVHGGNGRDVRQLGHRISQIGAPVAQVGPQSEERPHRLAGGQPLLKGALGGWRGGL